VKGRRKNEIKEGDKKEGNGQAAVILSHLVL
jgi:hypothetical protein